MLPKKERLKREDFSRFFASGKRFHHPFFTLIYTPSPAFHASVVVSKKIAQKAVDRNRMRRRVYAALRRISAGQGVFIVLVKKDALEAPSIAFHEALRTQVGQAHKTR